ncbi:MAG: OmpH family outer membrane protein [Gammaproteobacteria bacterium]|nr:OmpH family outer membrane protein [Gammaproteobacteria bacterium]
MNKLIRIGALVAGLAAAMPMASIAADLKIGVVNMREVMAKAPQREAITAMLKKEFTTRQDELRKLDKQIQGKVEKAQRDAPVLSAQQKIDIKRELEQLNTDFRLRQKAFEEDLGRRDNEEGRKLYLKVTQAIENIAKNGGYDIILARETVPYISERADITKDVLGALSTRK